MRKYALEFLPVFIAVVSAFALNNWNENRRDKISEMKILKEISNGLKEDIDDVRLNMAGHREGLSSCDYWRRVVNGQPFSKDSIGMHYFSLTRDFITIQNVSGYESLKSKGMEYIRDDALRYRIISLYEYDFSILQKFEEEYVEMQFQNSYYQEFNKILSPYFKFDLKGRIKNLESVSNLSGKDRNLLLSYLWKIEQNRRFILHYYNKLEGKTKALIKELNSL